MPLCILWLNGCSFNELEDKYEQLEERVSAMESILSAYESNLMITSIVNNGHGYTITFSDGSKVNVAADMSSGDVNSFKSITVEEEYVVFELNDGTKLSIPLYKTLNISFDESDSVVINPNSTCSIAFVVSGATEGVQVEVMSSSDIKAKVVLDDESGLTGKILVETGDAVGEYSKVLVFVSNGANVIMRSIYFEEGAIEVVDDTNVSVLQEGGIVELQYLSNVECDVVIPEAAQDWISIVPDTKLLEQRIVKLQLKVNEGAIRKAVVTIQNKDASLKLEYKITQEANASVQLQVEREALISIYNALDGDNWINNENWCSDKPVGEWFGVVVNENGFVRLLQLEGNNLHGSLSPEIGNLRYLDAINIKENPGVQSVPDELAECANLVSMLLPQITELPDNMSSMTNLTELNIDLYTGTDLSFLDNLKNLVILHISVNGLEIPSSIGNLAYLQHLSLSGFAGSLPSSLGNLTNLITLTITRGNLTGEIPSSFGHLQTLTNLNLSNNNLTGEFPSALFPLKNLQGFNLSNNKYYGLIPKELAGILDGILPQGSTTASFDISGNRFSGTIPKEVYEHPKWTYVWYSFYKDNLLDLTGVPIPAPDIEGSDIFGKTVDLSELLKERPYTLLYQYGVEFFGLSEMAFPNINSIKSLQERYPEKFNVVLWGEENVTADAVATTFDGAGLDDWTLCTTLITEANYIRLNNATSYPYNTYPYLSVLDSDGRVVFSSMDFGSYDQMNLLFRELLEDVDAGYYTSVDYSADGKVTTLQTATKGNGIDVVLMGDGYSDRLIADGTYVTDMQYMMDAFFSVEPYKSYKDYFNVYSVTLVSENEIYDTYSSTALDGWFGFETAVGGNDARCFNYALNAISAERMNEAMIIVAMNSDAYAGTCYMYYPTYQRRDYCSGPAVAYFPKGSDAEMFAQLLHHEANGHGFAKLADEYAYDYMGEVPTDYVTEIETQQDSWGWWKNVDFTSDPDQVRWSQFLGDSRYAGESLGCFEGGLTYWTGVWRPTEDSIMRYNEGEFNAPSREAIYYRIHKLAYGDSWEYNYEDFVAYDAVNRTSASAPARRQRANYVERSFEPTAPPVVVGKPWTEAK